MLTPKNRLPTILALPALMVIVFLLTVGLALNMPGPALGADPALNLLDGWLERQAQIKTWSAEVLQIRKLKSLARPLEARGRVWFRQPNRFRWQLGEPPRTIAVRTADALTVIYPKLKQAERFPISGISDPAWEQILALIEVGLPSDKDTFYSRYEVLAAGQVDATLRFELTPVSKDARRLLKRLRLEVSAADDTLLATELVFPDGSTMRNQFSDHRLNPTLDEQLFRVDLDEAYRIVEPLQP